ncbi:MAG: YigZ family protein [Bacilli bacterium]|nr:YigZ family protein [Bacilli bacterium]
MKTINKITTNEIIINKSKFITIVIPVNKIENVEVEINNIKKIYKGATHYCFGYIIDNHEKYNDDKEPSKTAGLPILNVLKQNNLTNILCIVVRYFGGIKLGSGGLIRAYSTSTSEALKKCQINNITDGLKVLIEFKYENIKQIDYLLQNIKIKKIFQNNVIYEFKIKEIDYNNIKETLNSLCKSIKTKKILISN